MTRSFLSAAALLLLIAPAITAQDSSLINANCGDCESACTPKRARATRCRTKCENPCSNDPWDCDWEAANRPGLMRWLSRRSECGVGFDWFNNCDDNWCKIGSACGQGFGRKGLGLSCGTGCTGCNIGPRTLFSWRAPACASPCEQAAESGGDVGDDDEPLITDRPDFTEASSVVGYGVLQVESGYRYTFDNDGTNQTIGHAYPDMLVRYGVFKDWLELRIGWTYAHEQINGVDNSGSEDMLVGFKIGLTEQQDILPEMAFITHAFVPTGGRGFSNDQVLGGAVWLYSWELNDCLSIGMNTGLNQAIDDGSGNKYYEFSQSISLGMSITDKLGAYGEWYTLQPSAADTMVPEHYIDGGFTYLINNNLQFDVYGGYGLNDAADDYFLGSGLSFRFR